MRLIVIWGPMLAVLSAACATSSSQPPASTTAAPATSKRVSAEDQPELKVLPFAWPVGASAIVTEDVLKKGREAKLTYRVEVSGREGGGIAVQIKDLKFLALGGFDLNDPEAAKAIAAIERQSMAAMPAFLVSAAGEFEDITDYERLNEMVLQLEPEDRRAKMRQTMSDPAMRALVRDGISKIWGTWAGAWTGQGLAEGYAVDVDMTLERAGKTYTFPASYEHKGPASGVPGHVDLSFTSTLDGEAGAALMQATLSAALGASGPEDPKAAEEMHKALRDMSVSRVATIHATVDASTLLPARCESKEQIKLVIDGERIDSVERHSYQFTWTLPSGTN